MSDEQCGGIGLTSWSFATIVTAVMVTAQRPDGGRVPTVPDLAEAAKPVVLQEGQGKRAWTRTHPCSAPNCGFQKFWHQFSRSSGTVGILRDSGLGAAVDDLGQVGQGRLAEVQELLTLQVARLPRRPVVPEFPEELVPGFSELAPIQAATIGPPGPNALGDIAAGGWARAELPLPCSSSHRRDERLPGIGDQVTGRATATICRGLRAADSSVLEIKQALLQNSSAYVTLKVSYTGLDGTRRTAADHNTRYGVSFRGSTAPDGAKNEAVFITWNEPFLEILNNTRTRPLDYKYLRALPPTARRWYELMSFLFYATAKNHQPYAELRYSEYCKLAPQKRLLDRHKAQTQMGKIHRHHVASGYLEKVAYVSTVDSEGKRDWIIRYYPGRAATEEFVAFNGTALAAPQRRMPPQALSETNDPPNTLAGPLPARNLAPSLDG
jgi:hypothetical protein